MSLCGAKLLIRGIVQGVGFRYFCYRTATRLDLVGWVKNMPTGSVEVVAEGNRGALEIFIKEVKTGSMHATITGIDVSWTEFTGKHSSFDIKG